MNDPFVYCADIGSIRADRFGWYGGRGGGADKRGKRIEDLVQAVVEDLNTEQSVALGFECPLWIPKASRPLDLTKARNGEGNRPWSAGAGTSALVTGAAEVLWVLAHIRKQVDPEVQAHTSWSEFKISGGLLLWEAFVSGAGKSDTHVGDAQIAVEKFRGALPDHNPANDVTTREEVFSLVGAALLRTGWTKDVGILAERCLVIKAESPG